MLQKLGFFIGISVLLSACAQPALKKNDKDVVNLHQQVIETERAFAKTMQNRDYQGFTAFISDEAVFFSDTKVLHGKAEVTTAWKRLYEKKSAPFSWAPDKVEVLPSGKLALSSGPVWNAEGKLIATFTSIWRMDSPGVWHIIFDKGNDVCAGAAP
ncbi:MAG: nuclear transport factor 2 family protein [Burkholderiales bacterium]|nr:nuclear transport factor 2 family protein [Burkholderiales bacterium]